MDFLKRIEEWIVGAFADYLVAKKAFEKLHLLVVASRTAAVRKIETGCF